MSNKLKVSKCCRYCRRKLTQGITCTDQNCSCHTPKSKERKIKGWGVITNITKELAYIGLLKEDMPKPKKGKYIRVEISYKL